MVDTRDMFGLSFGHILILLVIILLFGAKRLPELGGALGRGMRAFKKGLEGGTDEEKPQQLGHNPSTSLGDQKSHPGSHQGSQMKGDRDPNDHQS